MLKVVHDEAEPNEASGSMLDEIVREAARQMLAVALQAEVSAYIQAHAEEVDHGGGPVPVRAPRVKDKRTDPATGERKRFASAILPAWARGRRRCPGVLVRGPRGVPRDPQAAVLVAQDRQRAQRAAQVRPAGREKGARRHLERRGQGLRPRRPPRSPTTSACCWPSTTTPPSTRFTCAPPTRSSPPSPPSGFASESPRAPAPAPPVSRWRSSSSNQHRPGGGPSTHPAPSRWSVPARNFKNGKLIERPDESEGGDQQVA